MLRTACLPMMAVSSKRSPAPSGEPPAATKEQETDDQARDRPRKISNSARIMFLLEQTSLAD
jgi:hypothetical protein